MLSNEYNNKETDYRKIPREKLNPNIPQGRDVLNFKSVGFDLVNDPSEGAGGIGTGEDVFVHEESP